MFKRITALALIAVLALSLMPAANAFGRDPIAPETLDRCCQTLRVDVMDPNYFRPDYEGKLIDITPQRVADTFAYLDEHYVQNHPEQALMVYTGTAEDRENLLKLAETITAGCTTDTEKADAIGSWIFRNIYYDVNTSAYASDTFYRREGNCLSYANLMMFLLRSLGIPAVVGDGWRGDMKTSTVDLFNYEGHAWIFVLLNGEWVLYDPLWISGGTTDRDYMAEWIYFDCVEVVCPAYDGDNLPPEAYDKPKAYYTEGRFCLYSNFYDNTLGTLSAFINNQAYVFVSNQCEVGGSQDGRYYLDEGKDKTTMERGELYRDSWVSYGNYKKGQGMLLSYAFPNGMMPDGYTAEYDGKLLYMSYDMAKPILADEADYWIEDGLMAVKPGYTGKILGWCWQEGVIHPSYEERFITVSNQNPEVATMTDDGTVTCHSEGYAQFRVELRRQERDGSTTLMGSDSIYIVVSNEDRTPIYQDLSDHQHSMSYSHTTQATCEGWGLEVYKCSGCPHTEQYIVADPLGHSYVGSVDTEPTCTEDGITRYTCSRCQNSYTAVDIPASHDWKGTECLRCGDTRLTPFNDVVEDSFYETPVAWAVEGGITQGISATDFGSLSTCNRAQVVTFLWRAAGCPDPESMENPFTDVQAGTFYEKPVLWAVENGITQGINATQFGPNDPCNRAAVVTFLWRAANKPTPTRTNSPFTDTPAGIWYEVPVLWALEAGVTQGISATEFGATAACNRAQVVTFLYRAKDLLVPSNPTEPENPSNPGVNVPPSDLSGTRYVLNLSTMKFHYPSCHMVSRINAENYYEFVGWRDDLIEYDYSPCGHCDP